VVVHPDVAAVLVAHPVFEVECRPLFVRPADLGDHLRSVVRVQEALVGARSLNPVVGRPPEYLGDLRAHVDVRLDVRLGVDAVDVGHPGKRLDQPAVTLLGCISLALRGAPLADVLVHDEQVVLVAGAEVERGCVQAQVEDAPVTCLALHVERVQVLARERAGVDRLRPGALALVDDRILAADHLVGAPAEERLGRSIPCHHLGLVAEDDRGERQCVDQPLEVAATQPGWQTGHVRHHRPSEPLCESPEGVNHLAWARWPPKRRFARRSAR
jgi:hypothetical protein